MLLPVKTLNGLKCTREWQKKQEKKDSAVIESEIEQLEMAIEAIDQAMNENGNDYGKLSELQLEKDSKENDLLEKMTYWEYLSTLEN